MPFLKAKDPSVPPGQTVTAGFPVLHVGDIPAIERATWRLRVFGNVAAPFELTWEELHALPASEFHGDIHCVTRWSKKDTTWTGVRFSAIVARAQPAPPAAFVVQHGEARGDRLAGRHRRILRFEEGHLRALRREPEKSRLVACGRPRA